MSHLITSSRTAVPGHVTLTLAPHAPDIDYLHVQSTRKNHPRPAPKVQFHGGKLKGRLRVDVPYTMMFEAEPGVSYFVTTVIGSNKFNWVV
jgi:hypothetical protein